MDPWASVSNPIIPYTGAIPAGLVKGKIITISGHVPHGSQTFVVNLMKKVKHNETDPDLPLHISVRFNQRVVVRNSRFKTYGKEERDAPPLPFRHGENFELMILVTHQDYKIAVNGRHFTSFQHRQPFTQVNSLNIYGEVLISRIHYSMEHAVPTICPAVPGMDLPSIPARPAEPTVWPPTGPIIPTVQPSTLQPVYNPALPLVYPFQGGIHSGLLIFVSGRPSQNPYRFNIDFQCGSASYPPPDVALHTDIRFDQSCIVRNSKISNNWGPEERESSHFPFLPGVNFDMMIKVDPAEFMIAINGQHFAAFRHRIMPFTRIDTLRIVGDVIISSVRFSN